MDLENIGKQMLEALAIQGQVTSMVAKLANLEVEVSGSEGEITRSIGQKASSITALSQAEEVLAEAVNATEVIQQEGMRINDRLRLSKVDIERANEEVDKYSDAVLRQLDVATQNLRETKRSIEANRDKVRKELDSAQKNLENRQAILRTQGVDLNISGTKPQPKSIVL